MWQVKDKSLGNQTVFILDRDRIELELHELIDLITDGDGEFPIYFYRSEDNDDDLEFIAASDQPISKAAGVVDSVMQFARKMAKTNWR